jgi:hypothetical protein
MLSFADSERQSKAGNGKHSCEKPLAIHRRSAHPAHCTYLSLVRPIFHRPRQPRKIDVSRASHVQKYQNPFQLRPTGY